MEADPGTFDAQRLQDYVALGVSRFSIGIQAFQQVSAAPLTPEGPEVSLRLRLSLTRTGAVAGKLLLTISRGTHDQPMSVIIFRPPDKHAAARGMR